MKYSPLVPCILSLGCAIGAFANSAQADIFAFTYTDANTSAFGSLTATDNGNGSYSAISGFLTVTTGGIAVGSYALFSNPNLPGAAISPGNAFQYDNQLFPAGVPGTLLTQNGLLFVGTSDSLVQAEINIWGSNLPLGFNNYSGWQFSGGGYSYANNQGTFTLTLVPVPQAAFVGLAGLGGVAGMGIVARRRTRA